MRQLGAHVKEVDLVSWEEMVPEHGDGLFDLFGQSRFFYPGIQAEIPEEADFRKDIERYLASLSISKVRTLADIIEFNEENAARELPPGRLGTVVSTPR